MDMATSDFSNTSDLSDINVDQVLADAIKGEKESLDRLRFSKWFTKFLKETSARWAYRSGLDAEEIRDFIFDKISASIQDVENPNARSFQAWCKTIARSFCSSEHRHIQVEQNHRDDVAAREGVQGWRKSVEGGAKPLRSTDENSPYESCLESEIAEFCERIRARLQSAVRTELANSSPTDIRVVFLWGAGDMNLAQTAAVMGIATATVQRHLVAWQKRILQQPIVHQVLSESAEDDRNGLSELFRNAIKTVGLAA